MTVVSYSASSSVFSPFGSNPHSSRSVGKTVMAYLLLGGCRCEGIERVTAPLKSLSHTLDDFWLPVALRPSGYYPGTGYA